MGIVRRQTRKVDVGNISIGGGATISVQTMIKSDIKHLDEALRELDEVVTAGADIVRFAVPDREAAKNIKKLVEYSTVPLVADIHFDPQLAITAIEAGVAKLRLNPGTIKDAHARREVVMLAKERKVPIRIGLNFGSLPLERKSPSESLTDFALRTMREEVDLLEELGFHDIVLSIKSSDPMENLEVNRRLSSEFDYPIHLGVTEAGQDMEGLVYSVAGMAPLLEEGIGDTIRVSLNGPAVDEVKAGRYLLMAYGLSNTGVHIVACPTCGRLEAKTWDTVKKLRDLLARRKGPLHIAVMGCMVNGPQEAARADLGVALGKSGAVLFRKGTVVRVINDVDMVYDAILEEIRRLGENESQ
ncbi:flavodoxin-dependent (E)-4-hydroxy-3-methylbut-2-enyl-diphosphate synthase [Coprothermobacteraceae bacterium]|nr:flavodoxin-dependent (E)-4-hydroxy-3-methylbut-2-enyl-diphosphate synthase [Coprothermobacteraceae bacterium]